MANWTFEEALAAIQSPLSIPVSVLLSADGICLGDICFTPIQNTLRMRTVPIAILEKWVANGSFNPKHLPEEGHNHSTTILILLNPNKEGTVLESASIRLVIRRQKGPVGWIGEIPELVRHARCQMTAEWQSSIIICKTFCILVGDYGGQMAFATDPPFCTAYPLSFIKYDPAQMTFWCPRNHPTSFPVDVLMVHQLLTWDCPQCEEAQHRRLIIPRGVYFLANLSPQIVIPHSHAPPYRDPQTREEAPFVSFGPFVSTDPLFYGQAGNLT